MTSPPRRPAAVEAAVEHLRAATPLRPTLGIVLGSGFGAVADTVGDAVAVPYSALAGFPPATVPGHAGCCLLGLLGGQPVVLLAGRAHYYEGHDLATVTFPIRALAAFGVRTVLLTNAAGGIRPDLLPGDLVGVTDHLNFLGANPLRGPGGAERFVDLSAVYSLRLLGHLGRAAEAAGVRLKHGIYAALAGPSYETPAEIRALAMLGADLVGMSTVPEAIVARQCGLEVAALSCVTNQAAGLGGAISHDEVLTVGRAASATAVRLLTRFAQLAHEPPATPAPPG